MKVILFDLDGTLINSTEAILEGFKVTFEKYNKPYPGDENVKKLIGLPLEIMFFKLGIDENVDEYVNTYKMHYRKISTKKTKLLPFTKEALNKAKEFARLGIVTTKTAKYSKELLDYFNLTKFFEVLIGREDVINPKPHPEPIFKAIHFMKANKENTFMVGDTCLDVLSAKEAGIKAVGVKWEYEENLKNCAEIIKENVLEAVEFIEKF
ncbi:HAD family hydrolase [Lebetimonas sp. JS138]|uniref:HAD family hydrolase n=1 Tax=Lebetimonas sp. JS138 TaxID=990072 RepID=UPI000465884B|nr:HAD family hydrolase [Lebetimonas sp. JS138]